jgi:hypothetical protein
MRGRKLRWVLAGLAVLLLAVGTFALWPRPDRITRENFDRIKAGMSLEEIEAILGPPGDYTTRATDFEDPEIVKLTSRKGRSIGPSWDTDEASIGVTFFLDPPKELAAKMYHRGRIIQQSPLESLLWRAKRQWRKWFPDR